MEGAVRSGYLAAEAILDAASGGGSATHPFLRPELPTEGLSRWWAG
jgi:flavin-dependent dehydrogenase